MIKRNIGRWRNFSSSKQWSYSFVDIHGRKHYVDPKPDSKVLASFKRYSKQELKDFQKQRELSQEFEDGFKRNVEKD